MRKITLLLLSLLPVAASAEPLSFGEFDSSGRVELSLHSAEGAGNSGIDLSGDASLRMGLGLGFGLELGLLGLARDLTGEVDTPHETYGALTWEGAGLALSLGVVRPAYDLAVISPLERMAPRQGLAERHMGQTRSRATWGAVYDGGLPEGVRLSGGNLELEWAVSAHRMGDVNLAGAAFSRDLGDTRFGAALELASDGHSGAKAGISREFGSYAAGVAGHVAPAPGLSGLAEAWLGWHLSDRVTFTGLMQAPTGSGPSLGALSGEWAFSDQGSAVLTVTGEDGKAAASLGIDWRF